MSQYEMEKRLAEHSMRLAWGATCDPERSYHEGQARRARARARHEQALGRNSRPATRNGERETRLRQSTGNARNSNALKLSIARRRSDGAWQWSVVTRNNAKRKSALRDDEARRRAIRS
jgi:hypothetical protein